MLEHRHRLFLFGGFGDAKGRFNDLWAFDESKGWRLEPTKGDGPKPIYLHSACMWNGKMVVYGGNIGKDSNDMYTLDLDSLTWARVLIPTPAAVAQPALNPFAPPATPPPTAPTPRYGHASCINNNQLIIVGGCRQNSIYFQDAYAFTFATGLWRRLGDVPIDLAYHSLWSYGGTVYLFGGYNGVKFGEHLYSLDPSNSMWVPVRVTGQPPPPCCGVAASVLGKFVYVFGGYTQQGHTNQLYRLDMSTRVWELLNTANKPQPRAYLQSAVIQGNMYIFGGYDGSKCVTDFKVLRVGPAGPTPSAPAPPVPYSRPSMPVIQPPTPSIPVSGSASVPLNALFAGLNVQQPNSHAAAAPTLASVLKDGNVDLQVEFVMKQYGAGKQYLDRKDVEVLMMNLSLHAPTGAGAHPPSHARPAHSSANASASRFPGAASSFSQSAQSYPRLQDAVDVGFTRTHVLTVLDLMQQQGQDTRNFELVIDRCLKEQEKQQNGQLGVVGAPGATELAAQLHSALAEKDEVRQCTICYDDLMDCVLLECGHLLCCMSCGKGLIKQALPCPVCRKNIKGTLKIYWN